MTVILLITLLSAVLGVQSDVPCRTPNGKPGLCTTRQECPEINKMFTKPGRTRADLVFLGQSRCRGLPELSKGSFYCCPDRCYTPDGIRGQYVEFELCPEIKRLFDAGEYNFILNSRSEDGTKFCCGSQPRPEIRKGNCHSTLSAFPPDPKTDCCGIQASGQDKIVGGTAAGLDELPWMAILNYKRESKRCSGSLISNRYVLTAAHCVSKSRPPISVTLGEFDLKSPKDCSYDGNGNILECADPPRTYGIEQSLNHPDYNPTDPTSKNDISLLRLSETVPYTDFIRPICLPSQYPEMTSLLTYGTNLTAAGWGVTDVNTLALSDVKLRVDLPYIPLEDCARLSGRTLWDKQLCAGGEKNKDSCAGDSGGPLIFKASSDAHHQQVGIVSSGPTQCGSEKPAVYTEVSKYNTWILRNIRP